MHRCDLMAGMYRRVSAQQLCLVIANWLTHSIMAWVSKPAEGSTDLWHDEVLYSFVGRMLCLLCAFFVAPHGVLQQDKGFIDGGTPPSLLQQIDLHARCVQTIATPFT